MADQPKAGDDQASRRAELLARREQSRVRARRRRLLAAGALVLFAAAIATIMLVASGDDGSGSLSSIGRQGTTGSGGEGATGRGAVRNASPQPDGQPHTGPVPILEYHVLGEPPAGVAYPELYVARPDFRHQLEWLDRHGYQAVTLEQVEED